MKSLYTLLIAMPFLTTAAFADSSNCSALYKLLDKSEKQTRSAILGGSVSPQQAQILADMSTNARNAANIACKKGAAGDDSQSWCETAPVNQARLRTKIEQANNSHRIGKAQYSILLQMVDNSEQSVKLACE